MKTISFQNDILPLKDMLFRLALRITLNREDAEDVVQETLIKCWSKRDSWQDIDSIQAFATTICRNIALDCTKRAGRKEKSLEQPTTDNRYSTPGHLDIRTSGLSASDIYNDPLQKVIQEERFAQLQRLIDALPENQKLCLQLRDFEEKSYKEIAELLQMTEQQVKTNIFRARQGIKLKIKN